MIKSSILRLLAAPVLALIAAVVGMPPAPAGAQAANQIALPLSRPQAEYYAQHPQELQQLRDSLSQAAQQFVPGKPLAAGSTPAAGSWTTLTHGTGGVAVQNPLLMTDGTVIALSACTGKWYKLTPDNTGSYLNGTWAAIGSMPSGYAPLFGGSGVLPDGRVVFEGGEYNVDCSNGAWTTLGAIYNPATNTWAAVSPPSGWTTIGDAAGIVLDNGSYMQSDCCDTSGVSGLSALLNASTLAWTSTGSSKLDRWDEEGMVKLQTGRILDVDAHTNTTCTKTSELYNQGTGTWAATGNTVDPEPDCSNPGNSLSYELGPVVARQDGSAVVFPGILCSDVANTNCKNQASGFVVTAKADIYNAGAGTWSTGPTIPQLGTAPNNYFYSLADAPGAVLPDGNVLIAASPDYQAFVAPTHFFELNFSSNTLTQVGDTADAASAGAYVQNFLVLPTGQVLGVSQLGNVQIYTPLAGSPQAGWAPVVSSVPSCVAPGGTYTMSGTQLNGLTEGSYYGDDVQAAVNFPVVRIMNNATSHVFYAKTFNHSTRSIAPGTAVSTSFTVAAATETGPSTIVDVGAGIASSTTAITVSTSCPTSALTDSHDFNADGKSDILWHDTSGNVAMWLMNGAAVSQSAGVGNAPTTWSIVGQRDFNGDGKADILWHDTSGNVAVWGMNGAAVAQSLGVGNAPTTWSVVGTGDFNGDSKGDILWRDTSGNVAIWLGNGSGVGQSCGVGNAPTTWTVAGTGDFDGDGKTDILWHDTSGNVAIWFMNGCTVSQSSGVGNAPTTWSIAGTGDFNGDGKSDILWHDTSGNVAIWLMNSAAVAQSAGVGSAPTTWSIAQTGDYNGDGKSDILWHDTSGNVAVWEMNGVAVSQSLGIGNAPTVWSVQGAGAD